MRVRVLQIQFFTKNIIVGSFHWTRYHTQSRLCEVWQMRRPSLVALNELAIKSDRNYPRSGKSAMKEESVIRDNVVNL